MFYAFAASLKYVFSYLSLLNNYYGSTTLAVRCQFCLLNLLILNTVWQKLEEENADFFRAYYIRLKLKKQIILFNHLLEHQYHLMKYPVPPKVPLTPVQNGVNTMPGNFIYRYDHFNLIVFFIIFIFPLLHFLKRMRTITPFPWECRVCFSYGM